MGMLTAAPPTSIRGARNIIGGSRPRRGRSREPSGAAIVRLRESRPSRETYPGNRGVLLLLPLLRPRPAGSTLLDGPRRWGRRAGRGALGGRDRAGGRVPDARAPVGAVVAPGGPAVRPVVGAAGRPAVSPVPGPAGRGSGL